MFFFSPYFSTDEKQDGLRRTVTEADESFLNFLSLLLENHRMPVIFRVRREYDRLWREANHLLAVQITERRGAGLVRSPRAWATRSAARGTWS